MVYSTECVMQGVQYTFTVVIPSSGNVLWWWWWRVELLVHLLTHQLVRSIAKCSLSTPCDWCVMKHWTYTECMHSAIPVVLTVVGCGLA